jgi:Pectinacetylesterase
MNRKINLIVALLFFVVGCANDDNNTETDTAPVDTGWQAPEAAVGQWQFEPIDGAVCGNGEPTGIGMNLNAENRRVLIFLRGGGGCWDVDSCYGGLPLASFLSSGYGEDEFVEEIAHKGEIYFFPREETKNPFREDNYFYIPYCTGDLHTGDKLTDYGDADNPLPTYHMGRINLELALERIAELIPNPTRLVVSGGSAGGYGAIINYHLFSERFPDVPAYLIDDSGPPLTSEFLVPELIELWQQAWNLEGAMPPDCEECATDLSAFVPYYIAKYPHNRMALLSFTQDYTVSMYLGLNLDEFDAALQSLTADYFEGHDNFNYFYADAVDHVLTMQTETVVSENVVIWDWLTEMVEDDPAWQSLAPADFGQ